MKSQFLVILFFSSACLLPKFGMSQSLGQSSTAATADREQAVWVVAGKVKTVQGDPVRGAAVIVAPLADGAVRGFVTDVQGEFRTEYQFIAEAGNEFSVIVTVKKKGFQTAHTFADFGKDSKSWELFLTLRGMDEDPTLLSPADLISGLAPRLKQLGPAEGLAAKSAKDYAKGVAAYFEHHNADQAIPLFTRVVVSNPSCVGCKTMLGLAELGWCDWNDGSNNLAESVNASLHDRKMGRPEPMVAYGTWLNWQHDPEKAEPFFLEALKYNPQDALALQELGRTLIAEQKFEYATTYLKEALAASAGPDSRLLYVEALEGSGRSDEAAAEMNRYLNGRDVKNMPIQVRQVWASVQNRQKVEALYVKNKPQKSRERLDFIQHPPADLIRGIDPAKDQAELNSILDGVGAKILELVNNFPNTSSLEAIQQEKLSRKGGVSEALNQKFRYLCMVPRETWGPGFIEYRADLSGNEAMPKGLADGFMLTQGFNSTALFFHPTYRPESTFHYLGRQNVNGRNMFVLAFAQIPGKAHLSGSFRTGKTSITTLSQGLAWFDAATYQIMRIHTELLAPLPELRLDKVAMDIDFNPVHFTHVKEDVWLPEDVTVTLNWNGRQLRNRHEYSDFRVFGVDAMEKIAQPKGFDDSSKVPQVSTDPP